MSPEERMRGSDAVLAELQAFNVQRIKDGAQQCPPAELSKLLAGSGLSSRRISSALAASRKGCPDKVMTATASALKALIANENDIDANPEMEMDDDSGRTPERVEQVRAEIRRRLDALAARREFKRVDGRRALGEGGAPDGEPAAGVGAAPDPAV